MMSEMALPPDALRAALDRLVPPVDGLPGAGSLGVLDDVKRMGAQHPRYRQSLPRFGEALLATEPAFAAVAGEAQDAALRRIEAGSPSEFALFLELVYFAYYSRPEVHARIGWRTGPLQPLGFALSPFDEAVLDTTRQRAPFWRAAPE